MEKISARTSNVQETLSKQRDASWRAQVTRILTACALHFRTELDEAQIEIYLSGLASCEIERVRTAFERCLKECEFLPKLRDLFERMPEREAPKRDVNFTPVKDWIVPYNKELQIHYYEDERGYRQSKMERIGAELNLGEVRR